MKVLKVLVYALLLVGVGALRLHIGEARAARRQPIEERRGRALGSIHAQVIGPELRHTRRKETCAQVFVLRASNP